MRPVSFYPGLKPWAMDSFSKPNTGIIFYLTDIGQRPRQKKQGHFIQEISLIQIAAKV